MLKSSVAGLALAVALAGPPLAQAQVSFAPQFRVDAGGQGRTYVATGDFNQDGDPDLALSRYQSGDVAVLLGGSGASFGAATPYDVAGNPDAVAIGDFDGNGDPDLATVDNVSTDSVSVLLGGQGGDVRGWGKLLGRG